MKKIFSFLFALSISKCYSATGNASDGELLALSVLVIISFILGTGYFIDFLKREIKTFLMKRSVRKMKRDEEYRNRYVHENNSLSEAIQI